MKKSLLSFVIPSRLHKITLLAFFLLTLVVGQVLAADEIVYTLQPAAGANNSYAGNCDVEIDDITWNITGNSQMVPWRIGGKSITNTDRTVYSKTAMGSAITKVELTVGGASSITVNSLKLFVASDADFNTKIDEVKATFTANSKITFTPSSPATEWATDAYYQFVFNVTVSGSSNKFVEFSKAEFYAEEASPSFSITAQSNNNSYGTVSLSGSTITATPASGYRVSTSSPYSISPSGSATVSQSDNTFTVTPSANTTITINFEAIPSYTVTLKDDNSTLTQASAGASVILPERTSCPGYTFAGWTKTWTSEQSSWKTTAPTIIQAGNYSPTADENLYPVYTKTEGGGGSASWVLSSSAPSVDDSIMVAYYTGSAYKYMKNSGADNDDLTVSAGVATPVANGKFKVVSGSSSGVSFQSGSHYLHLNSSAINVTTNQTNADLDISAGSSANSFHIKRINNGNLDRALSWTSGNNWTSTSTMENACEVYFFVRTTSTTSYISVPNCCTPLGQINGPNNLTHTVTSSSVTVTVETSYTDYNNVSGYIFKIYDAASVGNLLNTLETNSNSAADRSQTFTGLTASTNYWVTVTAKGDGSTYCATSEESARVQVTTSAAACSSYSFHYGTQSQSDWSVYSPCFSESNDNAPSSQGGKYWYLYNFTIPNKPNYYLGWAGQWSPDNAKSENVSLSGMCFGLLRANGCSTNQLGTISEGNNVGAIGTLRVCSGSNSGNKYIDFVPGGYVLRLGSDPTWNSIDFAPASSSLTETVWTTDLMEITSAIASGNYYVGLKTASSYVWSPNISQSVAVSTMGYKKDGGTQSASWGTGLSAGMIGKFRMWADNCSKNWDCHFVPYWELTFDLQGGEGTIVTTPAYVSCEDANKSVTIPNTIPTKTDCTFLGWATSKANADAGTVDYAAGSAHSVSLTGNQTLYAVWQDSRLTITWKVDGQEYTTGNPTTKVLSGNKVSTLPTTPANTAIGSCATKFMGWAKLDAEITSDQSTAPTGLFTTIAASPVITENTTFYAVFASETSGTTGSIIINADNSNIKQGRKFKDGDFTINGITFTYNGWRKKSNGNLAAEGGHTYSLYNRSALPENISSITITQATGAIARAITVYGSDDYNGTYQQITSPATAGVMTFNFSGNSFKYFYITTPGQDSEITSIVINYGGAALTTGYRTRCCTPWTAPTLTYASTVEVGSGTLNRTLGSGTTHGTVTYESSNTAVATVNSSTGVVTPVSPGEVTITATWAGNNTYCEQSSTSNVIKVTGKVTVHFEGNGGTGTMADQKISYNTAGNLSANSFTRGNYTFTGWNTSADGTGTAYADGASVTLESNLTLYAQWKVNQCVVIWKVDGVEYTAGNPTTSVDYGEKVSKLPTSPANTAIGDCADKFMGWSATDIGGSDGNSAPADLFTTAEGSPEITGEKTFYAIFAKSSGGGGDGDVTFNFGYANDWGESSSWSGTEKDEVTATKSGVTVTYTRNNSSLYASSTAIRFYKSNTLTFESSYDIKEIAFVCTKFQTDITSDVGTCMATSNALSWSGSAKSVTFTRPVNADSYAQFTSATISYGSTTYSNYRTRCGASLLAEDVYVTSAKGQKVKIVVPVTARNYTSNATLSVSGASDVFSHVGWTNGNSVTAGQRLETGAIIQYLPTSENTTNTATLTIRATTGENISAKVNGRSLPSEFAIVAAKGTDYYVLPSTTSTTASSRVGQPVNVTSSTVEAVPANHVYTLLSVDNTRYADHGIAVRLKGTGTYGYLKAISATDVNLQNTSTAEATDLYEWVLTTTDNENYLISSHNSEVAAKRSLRFHDKYFGMYAAGEQNMQLLPIGCSNMPINVSVVPDYNAATFTWVGNAGSHTLVVKEGGTVKFNQSVESGVQITGLSENTTYTYTLTPATSTACAVEGEFTTLSAPITITLSRNGQEETLTNVIKPYNLPSCPNPCSGWKFAGWSASEVAKGDAVTFITQATENNHTYYAVYIEEGAGVSGYTKVANESELSVGSKYVIGYFNESEDEVYTAGGVDGTYLTSVTNSDTDDANINPSSSTLVFTLGGNSSSGWTLSTSSGLLGCTAAKNVNLTGDGTTTWNITISDGVATISSTTSSYGTLRYNSANPRFTTYTSSSGLSLPSLYKATGFSYSTTTDCENCTNSSARLALGTKVTKNTESTPFTNAVLNNTNDNAGVWTSSNEEVATIDASGEVTIIGKGTTTITFYQDMDMNDASNKTDNICAVELIYELIITPPSLDVVEVTGNDEIIIEHYVDGNTSVVIEEAKTTTDGSFADDVFISKYYEAASNMKLFGIYNGTPNSVDFSKLRVRSTAKDGEWSSKTGDASYVELGNVSKLGREYPNFMIPPMTELIFWSNNYGTYGNSSWDNNEALRSCITMTIDEVEYDISDLEAGLVKNWYCLGDYKVYNKSDADGNNQMLFNGDDPLILERYEDGEWNPIDLLGAGDASQPVLEVGDENGMIKKIGGSYEIYIGNAKQGLNDSPGGYFYYDESWYTQDEIDAGRNYPLSTNRYYLLRKKDVKSGYNAVEKNKTKFVTLGTEWTGIPVGGTGTFCESGELFTEVGQYNYSHYYTDFEKINDSGLTSNDNGDGTTTVTVPNLPEHSCNIFRIKVVDADNTKEVKASVDYKVPIIIKGPDIVGTNSTTFFSDQADAATRCLTCDVAILNGGTLRKDADGITEVQNIEVYAGGKLYIPSGRNFTTQQLIMRSQADLVPMADIQGELSRHNPDVLFDKRIDGMRWYFFTLPYDCDLFDITFRNGEAAVHGVDYLIQYYDGEERAATATATSTNSVHWKQFTGTTLRAGAGYIVAVQPKTGHDNAELRFPMRDPEFNRDEVAVSVRAWGGDKTDEQLSPNHKGWNLIGNPFLNTYNKGVLGEPLQLGTLESGVGTWTLNTTGDKNVRYLYQPIDGGASYYQPIEVSSEDLPPFTGYFVQIAGDPDNTKLSVSFADSHVKKANLIIRRPIEDEMDNTPIWLSVDIVSPRGEKDQTTLLVSDQFTDGYDMMNDLVKWRGSNFGSYTRPLLASRNTEGEMAFNALPDATAKTGVALNYFAAERGQYTLSLSRKYSLDNIDEVWLYDSVEQIWHDLLLSDYSFSSARIDDKSRFTLTVRVRRQPKITTDISDISGLSDLRIVTGDRRLSVLSVPAGADLWIFDSSGKLIDERLSVSADRLLFDVPASGVYNVRVVTADSAVTLKAVVK